MLHNCALLIICHIHRVFAFRFPAFYKWNLSSWPQDALVFLEIVWAKVCTAAKTLEHSGLYHYFFLRKCARTNLQHIAAVLVHRLMTTCDSSCVLLILGFRYIIRITHRVRSLNFSLILARQAQTLLLVTEGKAAQATIKEDRAMSQRNPAVWLSSLVSYCKEI